MAVQSGSADSRPHNGQMASEEWTNPTHVERYLELADQFPRRAEGEGVLLDHIPRDAQRVLDLGTGDGRLLAMLQVDRPEVRGVALDFSDLMLDAAGARFAGDERVEVVQHNLIEPLPDLGCFDAVVSSMAIHHLEDDRKRSLYGEVLDVLEPNGVFANFEHVASPTERLHLAFFTAIDEPIEEEDPSDRTLDVGTQLDWLRVAGTEGYPFLIQLVGSYCWRANREAETISLEDAAKGVADARRRLGSLVHAPALAESSDIDKSFLLAMSEDDGPSRMADIRQRLEVSSQYASIYRLRLIETELIKPAGHGRVDFTLPYLRDYIREHAAAQI